MSKYKYLAVDPTTLNFLAFIDWLKIRYDYLDIDKISNPQLRKDFNYYKRLYDCVMHDEIRIVVLEYVYRVSKSSEFLLDFIKQFCYCSNFNSDNYKEKTEKILKLTDAYFNDFVLRGEIHPAPFDLSAMDEQHQKTTKKYVTMMAQATVEGCLFLTTYDYLVFDKTVKPFTRKHTNGIIEVNLANGYFDTMSNGKFLSPHPVLIRDIGPMTKNPYSFYTPELSKGILPASSSLQI